MPLEVSLCGIEIPCLHCTYEYRGSSSPCSAGAGTEWNRDAAPTSRDESVKQVTVPYSSSAFLWRPVAPSLSPMFDCLSLSVSIASEET
jgi:hypothetical protein